jgi:hypothetical protein
MTPTTIFMLLSSLVTIFAGGWAWHLTSSRSVLLNTVFGSTALLAAAYQAAARTQPDWAIILPFFCTMLFGGRFVGLWWRSRKEAELRLPAQLIGSVAVLALTATVMAWRTVPLQ